MNEIKAGITGAKVTYKVKDYLGVLMEDADITTLEYSVYDETNSAVVKVKQAVGVTTAEGVISLDATDTALNGTGDKEVRRLCLFVNETEYWDPIYFYVVGGGCA